MKSILAEVKKRITTCCPDIPILEERQEEMPFFLIELVESQFVKEMNHRYKKTEKIDIEYVGNKENFESVANTLYEGLLYLEDYYARAKEIQYEVKEGQFHLLVTYGIYLLKDTEEGVKFKELEVKSNEK